MATSIPAQNGTPRPKEVTKISPLLPICVLALTAAQAYTVLHKRLLAHPQGLTALHQLCAPQVGRYLSDEPANRGVCLLVEAFKTAIDDTTTRILLIEFAGVVAVATLIAFISANRSSAGVAVRWGATAFLLFMQIAGGALALPIFFAFIVYGSSSSARASFIPSGVARALLPAIVCGYVIPSVALLGPEAFATQYIWEWALVFWQIFPVLVSIITLVLGFCFTGVTGQKTTSDAMISTTFIVGTMDSIILGSFLMHVWALYSAYSQELTVLHFAPQAQLESVTHVMHAFFTVDFLGFLISIWTLIFYDTSRFAGVGKTSVLSAFLLAVFGTVFLGPGGSAAWAWSNIEKARLGALVADRPQKKIEQAHAAK